MNRDTGMEQRGGQQQPPGQFFRRGPMGGRGHMGGRAMGMPVERARDFKGTLKRLITYLGPRRYRLYTVFAMAAFSTVFAIISPKVMGLATTRLFEEITQKLQGVPGAGVDFAYLLRILIILGALYLFSALFNFAQQFIMAGVAQSTVYDMREDVNGKLARLPLKYFDSRSHGDILSRVTNDIDNISATLQQSLTQLITAAVTLAGVLVMMLVISPLLTLLTLTMLPLAFLVTRTVARRSQRYFARQQGELGELNGHVEEMFTGHVLVKAFGREEEAVARFDRINGRLYDAGWKAQFVSGIIMPLMMLINNFGFVIVSVAGGIMVVRRVLPIGDVQAFIQYTRQFTMPITQTATIANILQSTIASAERVFELLDEAEESPDSEAAALPAELRGEVGFRDVSFSYSREAPLIEEMNIEVERGQTVAIVGPTGAGKTTLVNLLMRFYEIDDGSITVDGIDIRKLPRGDLRALFGMVLQDTWLFNGTIRDNIAYGRPGATGAEISAAARAARADHFIRTLPEGYDTMLNEEGTNISQGQKQLITIARALLADPAILILDEATSSVDSRTELLIQKAMAELMRGRTNFVIAHRLSTIREADLILVMDEGRIIEKGTHRDLLAQGGFYAELYNSQFTGNSHINEAV